jgi:hypothetical protein
MLPPVNPVDLEPFLAPVLTATALANEARRRWRLGRKQHAARLRQARPLYLEVLTNLLCCRLAEGTSPSPLIASSTEWRRSGTTALLAEVLQDPRQLTMVAAAYALLEPYERLFRLPWPELLAVRFAAQDVVAMGQLVERFAEAERVLRAALYDEKGQVMIEAAIAESLARMPGPPAKTVPTRLRSAWATLPFGVQVALVAAVGWQGVRLLSWAAGQDRTRPA